MADWIKDAAYQQWLDGFTERNRHIPPKRQTPHSTQSPQFTQHFLQHMNQSLRNLCQAEGACVAEGVETWSGALTSVWEYAATHGANSLPDYAMNDLDDFIMSTLAIEIEVASAKAGRGNW